MTYPGHPSDEDLATTGGRAQAAVAAIPGALDELAKLWRVAPDQVTSLLTDDLAMSEVFDVSDATDLPAAWLVGRTPENLAVSLRLGRPPVGVRICRTRG
jgi:hypothetical protein